MGMRKNHLSLCVLETEARERQHSNGCKNMPVKRKGVSDRANQTVFKVSKVLHLHLLYDLVQSTGERK